MRAASYVGRASSIFLVNFIIAQLRQIDHDLDQIDQIDHDLDNLDPNLPL